MLTLAAFALISSAAADTVSLYRGAPIVGVNGIWSYQAVADTYLDSASPDENFGGETSLLAGGARTILIRFGDLTTVVPQNRRIKRATLVLSGAGNENLELKSVARVLQPWNEGPYFSLSAMLRRTQATKDAPTVAPKGSATWRSRRAGTPGVGWREPGGLGTGDVERISGAKVDAKGDAASIVGIDDAVRAMLDHPQSNYGLALTFSRATEFSSSQSITGRPRLELELEDAPPAAGADLSVTMIERKDVAAAPVDGAEISYVAHIKNVGTAPATGFGAVWTIDEREGATVDYPKSIAPGEESVLTIRRTYRAVKGDHRFQSVGVRIRPVGSDASPRNNELTIQEGAVPINVVLSPAAKAELSKGTTSPEDWIQAAVLRMNDVYLDRSRFSFAPEGARERVAIQSVTVAETNASSLPNSVFVSDASEIGFLRAIGKVLGLPNWQGSDISRKENAIAPRGGEDLYPGLMGYGDTRYEGVVPGLTILPYEPMSNPVLDVNPLEPTGLLSATDVSTLNLRLDGTLPAGALPPLPKTLLVRAIDINGRSLPSAELSFFQSQKGSMPSGAPAFTVVTSVSGSALLPTRDGGSPFGQLALDGGNQAFLVRASSNGVTEWGWLKAWQAMDSASRGSAAAAILDVRFNLPGAPLEATGNLAKDRIASDSAGSLPSKLSALTDGDPLTEATLSATPGDWVEIDLGRDRTTAEVSMVVRPGEFWSRFDVLAYATGQRPADATVWAKEVNLPWTVANRSDIPASGPYVSVPYRSASKRFRYLRIINRSGGPGRLAEIRVTPAIVNTGG